MGGWNLVLCSSFLHPIAVDHQRHGARWLHSQFPFILLLWRYSMHVEDLIDLRCSYVSCTVHHTAESCSFGVVFLVFVCFSVVVGCFLFVCCCCCVVVVFVCVFVVVGFFWGVGAGGRGGGVALLYNLVKGTCVCLFCHNNWFKILTAKQITTLSCHPRSNKSYCL